MRLLAAGTSTSGGWKPAERLRKELASVDWHISTRK
jgi:hypothetical protein